MQGDRDPSSAGDAVAGALPAVDRKARAPKNVAIPLISCPPRRDNRPQGRAWTESSAPALRRRDLSHAERRAYALADNRLAELGAWDEDILAIELQQLAALELDFDREISGFEGAKLDELVGVAIEPKVDRKADHHPAPQGPPSHVAAIFGNSVRTGSSAPTPETPARREFGLDRVPGEAPSRQKT